METIRQIARDIEQAGGRAFLIGGFVRDTFLNLQSKDIDVEVYNISPEMLESILSKYGNVTYCGQSFGVFKLGNYDFSLPRREKKNGEGHTGFDISIDPFMSIEEATIRRDLTINSMLMNPLTGEVLDPFNGMQDIKEGIIRHINDATFAEDPLRVMRVAQFSARFNFDIHDTTKALCVKLLPELKTLSRERFMIEIEKILMKAEKPSIAFNFMLDIGLLESLFPELAILKTIEQGEKHHPEGDAFEHTMLALDSIPIKDRRLDLMFAILVHDLGKAVVESVTEENGAVVHFHGHAEEGEEVARVFMSRLTNETALTETVVSLVKYHMRPYDLKKNLNKAQLRRLALKVNIDDLMILHLADLSGRGTKKDTSHIDRIITVWEEVKNEIHPIIKGRHLIEMGLTPSKDFGRILKEIFNHQLDGEFNSLDDGILFTFKHLQSQNIL